MVTRADRSRLDQHRVPLIKHRGLNRVKTAREVGQRDCSIIPGYDLRIVLTSNAEHDGVAGQEVRYQLQHNGDITVVGTDTLVVHRTDDGQRLAQAGTLHKTSHCHTGKHKGTAGVYTRRATTCVSASTRRTSGCCEKPGGLHHTQSFIRYFACTVVVWSTTISLFRASSTTLFAVAISG